VVPVARAEARLAVREQQQADRAKKRRARWAVSEDVKDIPGCWRRLEQSSWVHRQVGNRLSMIPGDEGNNLERCSEGLQRT